MKLYECPSCRAPAYFPNAVCGNCGAELSYIADRDALELTVTPCANRGQIDCNWSAAQNDDGLCVSCQMTEIIPDLALKHTLPLWADGEFAKRWVIANVMRWGWFDETDTGPRPQFEFKSDRTRRGKAPVTMGHANGVITLNIAESDDAIRVRNREMLNEDYRTMCGHVRHELAHFLFDRLSAESPDFPDKFRALFGDERADYAAALERHYDAGPPKGWKADHITPYASAHPHEDWAETCAHIMHLTDMVDSAVAANMTWPSAYAPPQDAYGAVIASDLIHSAVDLGLATNHLNRAMGLSDLYPFVLTDHVREKLEFAHFWLNRAARIG